jgi:signal transduction histidine kinase
VNKPCALQKVIADMMAKYIPLAAEKGLELGVSYPQEVLPTLFSDPRILQHILVNLVSNAIKYTEKGRITVFVKTLAQTATMIQLKISVADTGIGIDKDKLNFIFDKFSQVETGYTRTSSRLGAGLGLSVTKKLVDLLKGKIFVDSELGEGSTFSIVLDLPIFEECAEKTA